MSTEASIRSKELGKSPSPEQPVFQDLKIEKSVQETPKATDPKERNLQLHRKLKAELQQDSVPESIKKSLELTENRRAHELATELVKDVITQYIPTFDHEAHPIRVLLSCADNISDSRLKYAPTTTLVLSQETLRLAESKEQLAEIVLHELVHGLIAKGYSPSEIFDFSGVESFRNISEKDSAVPREDRLIRDHTEEMLADLLPVLLIAESGHNPRMLPEFIRKLGAPVERELLKGQSFEAIAAIIDEHALPATRAEAIHTAMAMYISLRGEINDCAPTPLPEVVQELLSFEYKSPLETALSGSSFPANLPALAKFVCSSDPDDLDSVTRDLKKYLKEEIASGEFTISREHHESFGQIADFALTQLKEPTRPIANELFALCDEMTRGPDKIVGIIGEKLGNAYKSRTAFLEGMERGVSAEELLEIARSVVKAEMKLPRFDVNSDIGGRFLPSYSWPGLSKLRAEQAPDTGLDDVPEYGEQEEVEYSQLEETLGYGREQVDYYEDSDYEAEESEYEAAEPTPAPWAKYIEGEVAEELKAALVIVGVCGNPGHETWGDPKLLDNTQLVECSRRSNTGDKDSFRVFAGERTSDYPAIIDGCFSTEQSLAQQLEALGIEELERQKASFQKNPLNFSGEAYTVLVHQLALVSPKTLLTLNDISTIIDRSPFDGVAIAKAVLDAARPQSIDERAKLDIDPQTAFDTVSNWVAEALASDQLSATQKKEFLDLLTSQDRRFTKPFRVEDASSPPRSPNKLEPVLGQIHEHSPAAMFRLLSPDTQPTDIDPGENERDYNGDQTLPSKQYREELSIKLAGLFVHCPEFPVQLDTEGVKTWTELTSNLGESIAYLETESTDELRPYCQSIVASWAKLAAFKLMKAQPAKYRDMPSVDEVLQCLDFVDRCERLDASASPNHWIFQLKEYLPADLENLHCVPAAKAYNQLVDKFLWKERSSTKALAKIIEDIHEESSSEIRLEATETLLFEGRITDIKHYRELAEIWLGIIKASEGKDPSIMNSPSTAEGDQYQEKFEKLIEKIVNEAQPFFRDEFLSRISEELEFQIPLCRKIRETIAASHEQNVKSFNKGLIAIDALAKLTAEDESARTSLLSFLLTRPEEEYFVQCLSSLLLQSYISDDNSQHWTEEANDQLLREFHDFFWSRSQEQQALIGRQLFHVSQKAKDSRGKQEAVMIDDDLVQYVGRAVFPHGSFFEEQGRSTLSAFSTGIDPEEEPFVLSALLFSANDARSSLSSSPLEVRSLKEKEQLNAGEAIASFLRARGPGSQLASQALASMPGVPEPIREPNRRSLFDAAPLPRYLVLKQYEKLQGELIESFNDRAQDQSSPSLPRRLGPVLGNGKMASTIHMTWDDGSEHALSILKPHAVARGQYDLKVLERMSAEMQENQALASVIGEMAEDARERLVYEGDYSLTAVQRDKLAEMYGSKSIDLGEETSFATRVPECTALGANFGLAEFVPGLPFAKAVEEGLISNEALIAVNVHTGSRILHASCEEDRSGGNVMYADGEIVHIDPKGIDPKRPTKANSAQGYTKDEREFLGQLIGTAMIDAAISANFAPGSEPGRGLENPASGFLNSYSRSLSNLREELGDKPIPPLIRSVNKALFTQSWFSRAGDFTAEEGVVTLLSIFANGADKSVLKGLTSALLSPESMKKLCDAQIIDKAPNTATKFMIRKGFEQFVQKGKAPEAVIQGINSFFGISIAAEKLVRIEELKGTLPG